MKQTILCALAFGCALTLASCAGPTPVPPQSVSVAQSETQAAPSDIQAAYQQISAQQAKQKMDEGGVTIVDVRTQEEYDEAHIPDAVLVPVESIGAQMPAALPDLDAVLLVYCRSGNRSKAASEKLVQLGYTNVYEFGGINDWPYDTQRGGADHEQ